MACSNNNSRLRGRNKNGMIRFLVLFLVVVGTTLLSESHVYYIELKGVGANAEIEEDTICVILDSLGGICMVLAALLFVLGRKSRSW